MLADIGMPGKSGYEVAQYVQESPRLAHIPVVLLTGAFEPVDQARADEAGCDGVLAKPFEPQLVIGRVKELLVGTAPTTSRLDAACVGSPAMPFAGAAASRSRSYFDRLDQHSAPAPDSHRRQPDEAPLAPQAAPRTGLDWFSGLAQNDRKEASDHRAHGSGAGSR